MNPGSRKNPMRPRSWREGLAAACIAPRCGAQTGAGAACLQPGMSNSRCRMHGGANTWPPTLEGLERMRAARTIHGGYEADERKLRELVWTLEAEARRL